MDMFGAKLQRDDILQLALVQPEGSEVCMQANQIATEEKRKIFKWT